MNELDFGPELEDDAWVPKKKSINKPKSRVEFDKTRLVTDYLFADAQNYHFKSWKEMFPDNQVKLRSLMFNPAWDEFFDSVQEKKYFGRMEEIFSQFLDQDENLILPHAELVFNSFNVLSIDRIKVVFIGQDPYPGIEKVGGRNIPNAMGFSFSVPLNSPKAASLKNIYENMVHFGHLSNIPESGCLAGWVMQGCFMINASFTTFHNQKNVHRNTWNEFTTDLMKYLNDKCENIVFLAWGKDAHMLCHHIDPQKHHIITSSHPSPMSFADSYTGFSYGLVPNFHDRKKITYPPFKTVDHFGNANRYLMSVNKPEIYWDLVDLNLWGFS